ESLTVAGMGSLGKVYTGARSMGSNLNQAEVLQKLKTAMQNLETNRPRMAMAMSMAHGTAVNYYKSEAQEAAVAKIQEEGWAPQEAITLLGILTNGGRRKGGHGGSSGIVSGGGSGHGGSSGGGSHGSGSGGSGKSSDGKKPDVDGISENGEFTVTLEYKEGMNKRDFERKAKYLERLSKEGKLTRAKNPVKRNKYITEKYKKDVKKRIERMYGSKDPEKAKELIKRVDTMNPDHLWDLQLNGPDSRRNLKLLDGYTNQQLGRDVWSQIRDVNKVPVGNLIKIIVKR
ncbi:hypothetical protein ACE5LO_27600, partial [Paenibacillus medicaginis]